MTTTVVDPEGSALVKAALRAIRDGVAVIQGQDDGGVALLGQTLEMVKVRALLSTHGEPWPSLSWTLGGPHLVEVLRLLGLCLTGLRESSATRDDADGVARFGRLERLMLINRDRLAARTAGELAPKPL